MAKKFRLRVISLTVNTQQEWGADNVDVRLRVDGASATTNHKEASVSKGTPHFYDDFQVIFEKVVTISVFEIDPVWHDGIGTDFVFAPLNGEKFIQFDRSISGDGAAYTLNMVLQEIPVSNGSDWEKFKLAGGFTRLKNLEAFLKAMNPMKGGGVVVCVIVFALIHNAYKRLLQKKTTPIGAAAELPARAVWLWQDPHKNIGGKKKFLASMVLSQPQEFLKWAKTHNINQTWIDVSPALGNPDVAPTQAQLASAEQMRSFCTMAAAQGMIVSLLCLNDAKFALKTGHESAKKRLNAVFRFIGTINPADRPTGIQIDIEPHTLDNYKKDSENILAQYVELLEKLGNVRDEQLTLLCQYVSMCFAVPWFWNEPSADFNSIKGKLAGPFVMKNGFDVAVMDYRQEYSWSEDTAAKWIASAEEAGQIAWIAFETNPSLDPVDDPSYSQPGDPKPKPKPGDPNPKPVPANPQKAKELEPDISSMTAKFLDNEGFATLAIDDANGYFFLKG